MDQPATSTTADKEGSAWTQVGGGPSSSPSNGSQAGRATAGGNTGVGGFVSPNTYDALHLLVEEANNEENGTPAYDALANTPTVGNGRRNQLVMSGGGQAATPRSAAGGSRASSLERPQAEFDGKLLAAAAMAEKQGGLPGPSVRLPNSGDFSLEGGGSSVVEGDSGETEDNGGVAMDEDEDAELPVTDSEFEDEDEEMDDEAADDEEGGSDGGDGGGSGGGRGTLESIHAKTQSRRKKRGAKARTPGSRQSARVRGFKEAKEAKIEAAKKAMQAGGDDAAKQQ